MNARSMTIRDMQAQLQELYGVEVPSTLISDVTEAVLEEICCGRRVLWRPFIRLSTSTASWSMYVRISMCSIRHSRLLLAVNLNRQKEPLGMWLAQTGGARVLVSGAHRCAEPWGE